VVTLQLEGRKILVTGGAGFIGSHLVDRLLKMGNTVIVYDNFDPFYEGKELNIVHHKNDPAFKLVNGDILDYDALSSVMQGVEVVFHEAAQPGVRYSIENPEKAHQVNATGTFNVLKAAKERGVKKVVYASSSSVYGVPERLPLDEDHPTNPTSPYAVSKLAAEKHCQVFYHVYNLPTASLRYFSVYGPRQRPDQVTRKFATALFEGKPPVIYGDGSQTRDFTFVGDVVEATILAAEREESAGQVFNIGYGRQTSINKVFQLIANLIGKENISPIYKPSYAGDFPHTFADVRKAKQVLEYAPKVDLEEGLNKYIEWHKEQLRTGNIRAM